MYRLVLALALATPALTAFAGGGCNVTGKAYDNQGRPMPNAVVRLFDLQMRRPTAFARVGPDASFAFFGMNPVDYRVDLISPPTVVTGSRLPTRSIWGKSDAFACAEGQSAYLDVHSVY